MKSSNIILLAAVLGAGIASGETNAPVSTATNTVSTNIVSSVTPTNAPPAAESSSTNFTGVDLSSFKIISDRNIFNASRSPAPPKGSAGPAKKVIKVNSLTLVGTMSSAKGTFAFFDGNAASYKKAVKQGDNVADFTLTEISPANVQLKYKEKTLKLAVGSQMRQQEEEEWKLTDSSEPMPAGAEAAPGADGAGTESATDSTDDPVLKRLMEQREKELKK